MSEASPRDPRARLRRAQDGHDRASQLPIGACCSSVPALGFLVLGVFPILYTFFLSLTRYSGLRDPTFIGVANYGRMAADPLFWKAVSIRSTTRLLAVPIGVVVAMTLALVRNERIREVSIYRAIHYLPSILPVFAIAFIFVVFLNPGFGLLNHALTSVGLRSPNWLGDPAYTKLALVMIAQLGAGQYALIFLASLRGSRSSSTYLPRSMERGTSASSSASRCR